ncbi:uncharacterized protein LOC117645455 [Thrips palmi]|uniref:Uncharacterized protein LOC117645455 n=1 Tax=Thrips palmi TaxID=161013 RepID=A0A6P8YVK6_THRPL|nr:uncharacterized protein LOC117645455 [Thrips palmi]
MASPGDGWPWAALCSLQWRLVLLLLLVGGHCCAAGWPPRPSRSWTRYCVFLLILAAAFRGWAVQTSLREMFTFEGGGSFMHSVVFVDILVKNLIVTALQAMLILRRFELAALVQCLVKYTLWCPPSARSWRGMTLVPAAFFASSLSLHLLCAASFQEQSNNSVTVVRTILNVASLYLTDLVPSLMAMLAESAYAAVIATCVFCGEDNANAVWDQVRSLARRAGAMSPQEDALAALQLRALRTRLQVGDERCTL